MEKEFQENRREFGLLGRGISYSFSRGYFEEKFRKENINATYENFDLPNISEFPSTLKNNPNLVGLNVTIPYKEQVIPYLDELDSIAERIGAVNTIKILPEGKLKGFNTDYFGFSEAIKPFLKPRHTKALILGTGGASKAVFYALEALGIDPKYVSRSRKENNFTYDELDQKVLKEHLVIVNGTPLGTSPKTEEHPPITLDFISEDHLVFDLIYNPAETQLMYLAAQKGASVCNGLRMLELQAEKSWEHWNN